MSPTRSHPRQETDPPIAGGRALLIVPPFQTLRRPALGASLLKAELARRGQPCDVRYFTFALAETIGVSDYELLGYVLPSHLMTGEWVFSTAAFSTEAFGGSSSEEAYLDLVRVDQRYDDAVVDRLLAIRRLAPELVSRWVEQIPLEEYDVVGLTSTFQQNVASIAFIRAIKARAPRVLTVIGGSNVEGEMGEALHRSVPEIDVVCSGESDWTFPELVSRWRRGASLEGLPGVWWREGGETLGGEPSIAVEDLDRSATPDFDDYFAALAASTVAASVVPELSLETSRGCWWGERSHCTFCGLNGTTMRYRSKSPDRAYEEIVAQHDRYQVSRLATSDNILDLAYFRDLFPRLVAKGVKLDLRYETKANLRRQQLELLREVGASWFQPGIESLSTHVLDLMGKGVKGIQNVQLLRWAAELGMAVSWNVLCRFPGEDPADYLEMARTIGLIPHLTPPGSFGQFRLDRFSPLYDEAERRGLAAVVPYPAYASCYPFPPGLLRKLAYFFQYDRAVDPSLARATAIAFRAVGRWKADHAHSRFTATITPEMVWLDDQRAGRQPANHLLLGLDRAVYLAADQVRSPAGMVAQVRRTHPDVLDADVHATTDRFVANGWLLREGTLVLALGLTVGREHAPELTERPRARLAMAQGPS